MAPGRTTKRVFKGNLWAANSIAARAWSTVTPYLAHIGLVILALLGLATIPETVRKQAAQASRRPQRVGIPNGIRFIFIVSAAAVFCAYSLLSLFTALAPTLVDSLIGIHQNRRRMPLASSPGEECGVPFGA